MYCLRTVFVPLQNGSGILEVRVKNRRRERVYLSRRWFFVLEIGLEILEKKFIIKDEKPMGWRCAMLEVITPEEALRVIRELCAERRTEAERVPLNRCRGRVLAAAVLAEEFVPGFDRSTVDGYAVRARDTFGCSDSLPAILTLSGQIQMGEEPEVPLLPDHCIQVPTGGAVPPEADAMVMVEYSEDYGDGTVGILKPAAPGQNLIFKGDDVRPGQTILPAGHRLEPHDIGALAAMGVTGVPVRRRPVVGIISTGDELVPADRKPCGGQIRDVNTHLLAAGIEEWGGIPHCAGILKDQEELLEETMERLTEECDLILISGGSSVGKKDATCQVIERLGQVLFHGIAMKPGKPTILGEIKGRPVMGLPGHPVAAFFVSQLFVRPMVAELLGQQLRRVQLSAVLAEPVPANHGRAQYTGVRLRRDHGQLTACPVHSKSGLITTLAGTDGYLCVPRDCEGLPAGSQVEITLYSVD